MIFLQHMRSYRFVSILLVMFLGVMNLPQSAFAADKTSQMVTYFPVPYAGYNDLYVSNKFDVGTRNGSFTLNLGNVSSGVCGSGSVLTADYINLRSTEGGTSTLGITNSLYTPKAYFGQANGATLGIPSITTTYLRLGQALGTGVSDAISELTAPNVSAKNVYLYPSKVSSSQLPECVDEDGYLGNVTWKPLTIRGETRWFLVCSIGDGDCFGLEAEEDACLSTKTSDGYFAGSWNEEGCYCDCNSAGTGIYHGHTSVNAGGYCEVNCHAAYNENLYGQNRIEKCASDSHGTWNWITCECNCNSGYYANPMTGTCSPRGRVNWMYAEISCTGSNCGSVLSPYVYDSIAASPISNHTTCTEEGFLRAFVSTEGNAYQSTTVAHGYVPVCVFDFNCSYYVGHKRSAGATGIPGVSSYDASSLVSDPCYGPGMEGH